MTRLAGAEGSNRAAAKLFPADRCDGGAALSLPAADLAEFSRIARDDEPKP